ncbi:hypothetical protein FACS1894162_3820 [Bacteroidia bacterium]|nr:hypothetical protein FACS1894162_3820 [Bacteroidia bacterium]
MKSVVNEILETIEEVENEIVAELKFKQNVDELLKRLENEFE